MSGQAPVRRQAPGKLFIAGEYAVLEPGHPAILVAVDREVSVTVSAADGADVVIESDLATGQARLRRRDGVLTAFDGGGGERPAPDSLGHVVSAIEVVDGLLAARGLRHAPVHVAITSRLHVDGTKFGLGSSGAVTVATVSALAAYHGVDLAPEERFRLALLATARLDPGASGGDLAASVWGGWIAYQAPNRAAVLDMARRLGVDEAVRAPWPGFALHRLPPPRALALEVGWTGQPASTSSLTGQLEARRWRGSAAHRGFVARSDECVRSAIRALEQGDDHDLVRQVRAARQVLAGLDGEVGLGIFTSRLTALCDAAEAAGGAAKPSGAGGGDCGIALLDATADERITRMRARWAAAGVQPMPIHVQATNETIAGSR
ncbi:phosphomevalonate kinase [Phytohabitans houttuyneae]|uniref:phosphomevalonate kinase n=1 Tax=Phytohabitans houttuyneae TaxID=1076126 RepID=A0A6V8K3K2_9ACTN|nr:phosphomevalonate kinase [Phytohabitans houttuyneae]GFJ76377.1 phosphomevalonate kinase [Phytohabitans houttuyneae]